MFSTDAMFFQLFFIHVCLNPWMRDSQIWKANCTVNERNEVLVYATTWMKLENIMLSERSQSQKTTYRQIYGDRM